MDSLYGLDLGKDGNLAVLLNCLSVTVVSRAVQHYAQEFEPVATQLFHR